MSKKAKEILEMHMGSDYYLLQELEYFENLVNAVDEALSIPIVRVSEQEPPCTGCGRIILTEKDQCSGCRIAEALLD